MDDIKDTKKPMSFYAIFKNLLPYIKPYKFIIIGSLFLTLIGAGLAQVKWLARESSILCLANPILKMRALMITIF